MAATIVSMGWEGLSPEDKMSLIEQLWESIAKSTPPGYFLTDAKREELDRRIADADANPDDAIPWEQVQAEILAELEEDRKCR